MNIKKILALLILLPLGYTYSADNKDTNKTTSTNNQIRRTRPKRSLRSNSTNKTISKKRTAINKHRRMASNIENLNLEAFSDLHSDKSDDKKEHKRTFSTDMSGEFELFNEQSISEQSNEFKDLQYQEDSIEELKFGLNNNKAILENDKEIKRNLKEKCIKIIDFILEYIDFIQNLEINGIKRHIKYLKRMQEFVDDSITKQKKIYEYKHQVYQLKLKSARKESIQEELDKLKKLDLEEFLNKEEAESIKQELEKNPSVPKLIILNKKIKEKGIYTSIKKESSNLLSEIEEPIKGNLTAVIKNIKECLKDKKLVSDKKELIKRLKFENIYKLFIEISNKINTLKIQSLKTTGQHDLMQNNKVLSIDGNILIFSFLGSDIDRILKSPKGLINKLFCNEKSEFYIHSYLNKLLCSNEEESKKAISFLKNIINEIKASYSFVDYKEEEFKQLSFFNAENKTPDSILILDTTEPKLTKTSIINFLKRCSSIYKKHAKYYLVLILVPWHHVTNPEVKTIKQGQYEIIGWHRNIESGVKETFNRNTKLMQKLHYITKEMPSNNNEIKRHQFETKFESEILSKISDEYPKSWKDNDLKQIVIETFKSALQSNSFFSKGNETHIIGQVKDKDIFLSFILHKNKEHTGLFIIKTNYPFANFDCISSEQGLMDAQSKVQPYISTNTIKNILLTYLKNKKQPPLCNQDNKKISLSALKNGNVLVYLSNNRDYYTLLTKKAYIESIRGLSKV